MRFHDLMKSILAGALICGVGFCLRIGPLAAQSASKGAASSNSPCSDADFWIGEWNVTDQHGAKVSTASIKPGENHCYITESWISQNGGTNYFCLIAYSNVTHDWEYLCAAPAKPGTRIRYSNGVLHDDEFRFVQDDMVDGRLHRFSYFKLADGLRELSAASSDGGKTWTNLFDVKWTRKK